MNQRDLPAALAAHGMLLVIALGCVLSWATPETPAQDGDVRQSGGARIDAYGARETFRRASPDADLPSEEPPPESAVDFDDYLPMPLPSPPAVAPPPVPSGRLVSIDLDTREVTYSDPTRLELLPDAPLRTAGHPGMPTLPGVEGGGAGEDPQPRNFSALSRVLQPWEWPYTPHVKLLLTFRTRSGNTIGYECSGTLIDPYHVLTAGHCVYLHENIDDFAESARVYPGYTGNAGPLGSAASVRLHSWTGWTQSGSFDHDMGIIDLDRPIGVHAGWHGYASASSCSFYTSTNFENPGYPAESPYTGDFMYTWGGRFDGCNGLQAYFDRRAYGGQSGSGAVRFSGNNSYVHAVLSNGTMSRTWDVRITSDKFSTIRDNFINDDKPDTFDLSPHQVAIDRGGQDVRPGVPYEISYQVLNYSEQAVSREIDVRIYLSRNSTVNERDTLVQTHSFNHSFAPLELATIVVPDFRVPLDVQPRNYFMGVVLDVTDADTGNNIATGLDSTSFTVSGSPLLECGGRPAIRQIVLNVDDWPRLAEDTLNTTEGHLYELDITRTGDHRFSFCAPDGSADFDSRLCLLDHNYQTIAQSDDDCGQGANLRLEVESGLHWLVVSAPPGASGDYTLVYQRIDEPPPTITLGLEFDGVCGDRINGTIAERHTSVVDCVLTTSDNLVGSGASAWSIAVRADNASILSITTVGTVAASIDDDPPGYLDGGFELSEITTGPANEGAVSSVVLDFSGQSFLPAEGRAVLAKLEVASEFPAQGACRTARLRYVDGLTGSGPPIDSTVRIGNTTRSPDSTMCSFDVCGSDSADVEFELSFGGPCDTTVNVTPGEITTQSFDCLLTTRRNPLDVGGRGWEIGMTAQGGRIIDIATEETAAAPADDGPPGRRVGGFEVSEITSGAGNTGAISAVVLSFTELVTLPAEGTETIARITVESDAVAEGECSTVRLMYVNDLQGAGQPVHNAVSYGDFRIIPVTPSFIACEYRICGSDRAENYVSYDCNNDGVVDLSDAVCHLGFLFGGVASLPCSGAMDFNGDGDQDISDVVAALGHLFLGGPEHMAGSGCQSYDGCPTSGTCP